MSVNRHESELAEIHAARLTAYALGQLEGQEQAEVERELAASPAARQTVESVRAMASHLRVAAQQEASSGPSASLRAAVLRRLDELEALETASRPAPRRFPHGLRLLVALAACLLVAALPVAWLTGLYRRPSGGGLALLWSAAPAKSPASAPPESIAERQSMPEGTAEGAPPKSPRELPGAAATLGQVAVEHDRLALPAAPPTSGAEAGGSAVSSPSPEMPIKAGPPLVKAESPSEMPSRLGAHAKTEARPHALSVPGEMPGVAGFSAPAVKAGPPRAIVDTPPASSPARRAALSDKPSTSSVGAQGLEDQTEAGRESMHAEKSVVPSSGGEGRRVPTMPGLPERPGMAEIQVPQATPKPKAEATAGAPEPPASVSEARPAPSKAWAGMGTGQPATGGYPASLAAPGVISPGTGAMPGRAAQAAVRSRGASGAAPSPLNYQQGRARDALDAQQRAPLPAQAARRAGSDRQTVLSESAGALQAQSLGKADTPVAAEHPFVEVGPFPVSEFPLQVDRASYEAVREAVRAGRWPRAETLDTHSLINAFSYRDPAPPVHTALTVSLEAAECPWKPGHRLVRIAVAAAEKPALDKPSGNEVSTANATSTAKSGEKPLARSRAATGSAAAALGPVVARDVRILVEFNPLQVAAYRFIGADTTRADQSLLAEVTASAATLNAGQRFVGLYQVIPAGLVNQAQFPQLRYQRVPRVAENLTKEAFSGQILTVHVQYRDAASGKMQQAEFSLKDPGKPFNEASADLRFAAAVAAFGMILRNSPYAGLATLEWVERTAAQAARDAPADARTQFVDLVRQLQRIPTH